MKTSMSIFFFLLSAVSAYAQGINLKSGTELLLGSSTLSLPGNWSNSGIFTANNGTIIFNGNGTQTITNSSGETFNNATVNKSSGSVQFMNDVTVNGNLELTGGDIDMNGHILSLGVSAHLTETEGNTVKGNGSISGTTTLNAPSLFNPFGLGATITSTENFGSTIITRGHAEQSGGGETSILRYFDISPVNNTGLNATLVFSYDESELNGKTETDLILFKSTDSGLNWTTENGTVNISENTVTLTGINNFSRWTLGSASSPLPVELISMKGEYRAPNVELQWVTGTELNNYGFEIEKKRMKDDDGRMKDDLGIMNWIKVGFVVGNGTTNAQKEYSFTDKAITSGIYSYRLKQIDRDGKFIYSHEVEVMVGEAPNGFSLEQNYPNPFNPSTTIGFTLQASGHTTLKIYDAIGRVVATLADEYLEAGRYHEKTFDGSILSSGMYFARLYSGTQSQLRKLLLLK